MSALQTAIEQKGQQIFALSNQASPSLLTRKGWYTKLMDWSMHDEKFKIQLFRFVDLLPSLTSSREVVRHLEEYFSNEQVQLAAPLRWGLKATHFAPWIVAPVIKQNVIGMARQFIAGQTGKEVLQNLHELHRTKTSFTVDILGEAVVSEKEADEYAARYLELLELVSNETKTWQPNQSDQSPRGVWPLTNVSVKISALYSQIRPTDPHTALVELKKRLRPIFRKAQAAGAFINFDMESYGLKDLTLTLFREILEEPEFKTFNSAGIAIQAYLKDSEQDVQHLISWAKSNSRRITIRLVKGAYWDYETIVAQQKEWPIPVFSQKAETDANFEKLTRLLLENDSVLNAALGTHNIRSISYALAQAEKLNIDPRSFEFQMLYGMADSIKDALIQSGYRVREYCPVGELLPGMAYFVRRLLENTSNQGFLRANFADHVSQKELLRDPLEKIELFGAKTHRRFQNCPTIDFAKDSERDLLEKALDQVRSKLGKQHSLVIDGRRIATQEYLPSINPARPSEIIGQIAKATPTQANDAIQIARKAQSAWYKLGAENRAQFVEKIGALLEENRFELTALEILEVGKSWQEADADVAEAIDFCFYYADQMRRLGKLEVTERVPGETSHQEWLPRGTGLIIAPWNFPLAILCGMTTAAIVTGNIVLIKPAEQASVIAARFMEFIQEAGLPRGVVNFIPGVGEEIGPYLVDHPHIDFIAFTGSKEVGLKIFEKAGRTQNNQQQLKKVICEMGGKNSLIVDSDADLDEAVIGAVSSAFGYQGQKCSALSRLIVLENNYEKFLERLVEATRGLTIGLPENPGTIIGPVIDATAQKRILEYIEIGKCEARLAYQATLDDPLLTNGYFVPPTIFVDVPAKARIAQEEIFGPVLSVFKVKDIQAAIDLANDSAFALTGGIFSRSPSNIEKAKREVMVGNLYINRSITGAIVGRHPFGGFKMSGGGTKAGGREYLTQFMLPRVITENCLRRGFAQWMKANKRAIHPYNLYFS